MGKKKRQHANEIHEIPIFHAKKAKILVVGVAGRLNMIGSDTSPPRFCVVPSWLRSPLRYDGPPSVGTHDTCRTHTNHLMFSRKLRDAIGEHRIGQDRTG